MPHAVFNAHAPEYDRWYDDHRQVYEQLRILRWHSGVAGWDLEIGVGTGRFAAPLGIPLGIDPSLPMLRIARVGCRVILGVAEALPFRDASFRSELLMTSTW